MLPDSILKHGKLLTTIYRSLCMPVNVIKLFTDDQEDLCIPIITANYELHSFIVSEISMGNSASVTYVLNPFISNHN